MATGRYYKWLSITQGFYFLLTALWPLIDMNSFIDVTGPKTDIWLVKTVAVLLIPLSICFLAGGVLHAESQLVIGMGLTSSAGLAFIDIYYAANGVIRWVYLVDGAIEVIFCLFWIIVTLQTYREYRRKTLHRYSSINEGYSNT